MLRILSAVTAGPNGRCAAKLPSVTLPKAARQAPRNRRLPMRLPARSFFEVGHRTALAAALAELPSDYQEVIVLRNLERLPFDEVGRRMDRSRPAVQMLWMRAMKKLREAMERTIPMADLNRVELPEDQHLADLLDAYLRELQAGRRPDRAAIVSEHPEMASLVEYLDALERIAPPSEGPFEPPAPAETPKPSLEDSGPSQPAMPQDFGAYELLEEIGCGGMGVVYKARQKGLERIVAVKMILASHLASPDQVRRFQEEARAAAGLRHPHIVHIHEVGQCHGQHYFAMEYIEGMSLAERLARGPLQAEEAARLVLHVARAVEHLHQHGYIHRDLKPSNILLDAEGAPTCPTSDWRKPLLPGARRPRPE